MPTLVELEAALTNRIGATTAQKVGSPTLQQHIQSGIEALWPAIYRRVYDSSLVTIQNQRTYAVPTAIEKLARVRFGRAITWSGRWHPGPTEQEFTLTFDPTGGVTIHLLGMARYDAATLEEPYTELALLYAEALTLGGRTDERIVYDRFAGNFSDRAGSPNQIQDRGDFLMGLFFRRLERLRMKPLSMAKQLHWRWQ